MRTIPEPHFPRIRTWVKYGMTIQQVADIYGAEVTEIDRAHSPQSLTNRSTAGWPEYRSAGVPFRPSGPPSRPLPDRNLASDNVLYHA